jgi:hypothetical protein
MTLVNLHFKTILRCLSDDCEYLLGDVKPQVNGISRILEKAECLKALFLAKGLILTILLHNSSEKVFNYI